MQLDPDVFLLAAEAISPDGHTLHNGLHLHASYACHAIKRAKYHTFTCARLPDPPEIKFFVDTFLDGDEDAMSPCQNYTKFGPTINSEHRIMALLLCWAMTSNP